VIRNFEIILVITSLICLAAWIDEEKDEAFFRGAGE